MKCKINVLNIVVLVLVLFAACVESPMEIALRKAGNNRKELQRVLDYFGDRREDSLKYKAACFLIENMPGHTTYKDTVSWDKLSARLPYCKDKWAIVLYAQLLYQHYCELYREDEIEKIEDVETLTADFLIKHIESVFCQKDSVYWMQEVSFEDFCEYLLPYRIGHEFPFLWRDSLLTGFNRMSMYRRHYDDMRTSSLNMHKPLYQIIDVRWSDAFVMLPSCMHGYSSDCVDEAVRNLLVRRLCGIPASIDVIPCWGNYNGAHEWVQPIDRRRHYTTQLENFGWFTVPKVYRKSYSSRKNYDLNVCANEYIPPLFIDENLKDVTNEYVNAFTVSEKGFPGGTSFGYLCVFNCGKWIPVAQSEVQTGECIFHNMGPGVVYLPAYYDKTGALIPVSVPFRLKNTGEKVYLTPQLPKKDMYLKRKYPLNNIHFIDPSMHIVLLASSDKNFQRSDTFVVNHNLFMRPWTVRLQTSYQYFRIFSTEKIAEIYFYNSRNERLFLSVDYSSNQREILFQDDDILTSTLAERVDFSLKDKGTEGVSSVKVLPVNDGNCICPNDEYELFYFDKDKCWVSCGYKIADDFSIVFKDVPQGGLYWLQNLSTGNEERVFTYENDEQLFW